MLKNFDKFDSLDSAYKCSKILHTTQ